jgi:hypothetical protein
MFQTILFTETVFQNHALFNDTVRLDIAKMLCIRMHIELRRNLQSNIYMLHYNHNSFPHSTRLVCILKSIIIPHLITEFKYLTPAMRLECCY